MKLIADFDAAEKGHPPQDFVAHRIGRNGEVVEVLGITATDALSAITHAVKRMTANAWVGDRLKVWRIE